MRDVTTLAKGERLYVHDGDIHAAGVFVDHRDGVITVDHTVSYGRYRVADISPYITDVDGEVVGEPEPPLPTTRPELE